MASGAHGQAFGCGAIQGFRGWVCLAVLVLPAAAFGQVADPPASVFSRRAIDRSVLAATGVRFDAPQAPDPRRACEGCPIRRLWRPYLESVAINVMYNGINHARGHESARVGPRSWWANMKYGFEWDANSWFVNQFGHPYQGSNYFTAGRANGLSFWESTAVAAFGSGTWEFFFENNRASLNDFINTTLGGIALGEVMHRAAWLVRDPTKATGRREIMATIIDPMSGLERALSDDWERVSEKPASLIPASLGWQVDVGILGQGTSMLKAVATALPFVDGYLFYGDVRRGSSRTPFEAFKLEFAAGPSLSHTELHGRLFGSPFGRGDRFQFTLFQTYELIHNPAYDFGGQGFEAEVSTFRGLPGHWSAWLAVSGGATVLAAANSLLRPSDGTELLPRSEDRTYDYGPGARFGGVVEARHKDYPVFTADYQAFHVNVVDGTRANHFLQRLKIDLRVPVSRDFAVGAMAEYLYRQAYFWANGTRTDESAQFRLFVTWSRK